MDYRLRLREEAREIQEYLTENNIFTQRALEVLADYETVVVDTAREVGKSVAEVIKECGLKDLTRFLNDAIAYWDEKLDVSEDITDEDLEKFLKENFGVDVTKIDKLLISAGTRDNRDSAENIKNPTPNRNRVMMALRVLTQEGYLFDDLDISYGLTDTNIGRYRSYWIIKLKDKNIYIAVNNQGGNQTFVFYDEEGDLADLSKDDLKDLKQEGKPVRYFAYYFKDEKAFGKRLLDTIKVVEAIQSSDEEIEHLVSDKEYFENPENIRRDLYAYMEEAGLESIEELTTRNMDDLYAVLASREICRGGLYIAKAGIALVDSVKNTSQARKYGKKVLMKLKDKIGIEVGDHTIYPEMDREYYTPENVFADLSAYVEIIDGVDSIDQLNTRNMQLAGRVICCNGENVKGYTYLYRPGKHLGFGRSNREAHSRSAEVLAELKKKAKEYEASIKDGSTPSQEEQR